MRKPGAQKEYKFNSAKLIAPDILTDFDGGCVRSKNMARQLQNDLFNERRGTQKELKSDPANSNKPNLLTDFNRVWVYSQGIALHQAARKFDTYHLVEDKDRAHKLFMWLYNERVTFPGEAGREIFGGWHFSQNTKTIDEDSDRLVDNFKDPRLVTGANAWALNGVARYIISSAFSGLSTDQQFQFRWFYRQILTGLLVHQRKLDGLFTAGWDLYILQNIEDDEGYIREHIEEDIPHIITVLRTGSDPEKSRVQEILRGGEAALNELANLIQQPNGDQLVCDYLNPGSGNIRGRRYNFVLAVAGYPDDPSEPYYLRVPEGRLRKRVKARNIVAQHNNNMLAVLNLAIDNTRLLGLSDSERRQLIKRRNKLRMGTFAKLYGGVKNRIVTIDTMASISISAKLAAPDMGGISDVQRDQLADALRYAIRSLKKRITFRGETYFGAHYFEPSFEDPSIAGPGQDGQEKVFHLEATTSLVLGLKKFWRAYQNHPYSPYFGYIADRLWENVVKFITDNGFIDGSISIQGPFEPLESSTTATWFIDTHDYLSNLLVSNRVPVIPEPESAPVERVSV